MASNIESIDITQTDENYYNIKINNITYPFVAIKKSDIKHPKYYGTNMETEIQITTTDLNLPLDTIVNVNEITHEKQNQIKEVLKTEDFKAFDIQLFSDTLNNHITVLEDGYFEVTIPLGTNYIGKNLVAYYIKNDNTLERHKVTMDAYGNATFETNHFSTYIIAEEEKTELVPVSNEQNPNTYDGITNDLLLAFFSIILFSGSYILSKKMRQL